jgi:predicted HTH transcriptional regulator
MTFDLFIYPNSAGHKTGGASREAAQMVDALGIATETKPLILAYLKRVESATAEEVSAHIGKGLHNVRSRLTELMVSGLIEKLNERGEAEVSKVAIHKWRII